jgi:hypothetical protein
MWPFDNMFDPSGWASVQILAPAQTKKEMSAALPPSPPPSPDGGLAGLLGLGAIPQGIGDIGKGIGSGTASIGQGFGNVGTGIGSGLASIGAGYGNAEAAIGKGIGMGLDTGLKLLAVGGLAYLVLRGRSK